MSKRFPFTKRTIEAIPPNDPSSPSREAEYSDAECIGLKLRVSAYSGFREIPAVHHHGQGHHDLPEPTEAKDIIDHCQSLRKADQEDVQSGGQVGIHREVTGNRSG